MQPLAKALAGFDASITGRKAFQSATRAEPAALRDRYLPTRKAGSRSTRWSTWNPDDLAAYLAEHDLPAHPLVAEGYPSIGCSPCTAKVAPGEDPRAGRWRGWDKTECGIHVPGAPSGDSGELPPDYDPVF